MNEFDVLVGGQWVDCSGDKSEITDPATGKVVSCVPALSSSHVDQAVDAARSALLTSDWAFDGRLRSEVMLQWADNIASNVSMLAQILTQENGKLIGEAKFEIANQVNVIRYNAGLARTVCGRSQSFAKDVMAVVAREPIGVVAVISPWNWPVSLMVRDMAPALAAGNAVLCKPASQTAGICVALLKLLAQCDGLPAGILSMLTGSGRKVGQYMVEHAGIDMIAFTGDGSTGRGIARDAANSLKKIALELGGKSPFVICADANLDKAVGELVSAVFTTTSGQICTAPSRLLVENTIKNEVCKRLLKAIAGLKVGNGMDPDSQIGPLTTKGQFEKVLKYIEMGKQDSTLLGGGDIIEGAGEQTGFFVNPAIFTDVDPASALMQDEIFGPVLIVSGFDNDEQAIAMANDSPFGLAAAVFTESLSRAWNLSRSIQAGTVWVNTYNRFYAETEVGGYKTSGIGRMAGIDGLMEFTQTKHINFDCVGDTGKSGRVG